MTLNQLSHPAGVTALLLSLPFSSFMSVSSPEWSSLTSQSKRYLSTLFVAFKVLITIVIMIIFFATATPFILPALSSRIEVLCVVEDCLYLSPPRPDSR